MEDCCPRGPRDTSEIVRYFDERVEKHEKHHHAELDEVSRTLVEALSSQGVTGKSLLEIGPGFGDVTFELLGRGVSKAQGVDLTPRLVSAARDHAERAGYSARTTFEVGDGAEAKLPRADIVILDKVMCCYPVLQPLLNNSLSACNSLYGFSVPKDKGVWGILVRLGAFFEKVGLWLRGCRMQTWIHSTGLIDSVLVLHGFRLVLEEGVGSWLVRIYGADGVSGC
jgi:magnesium-protoporphyrin O-methyltransferase